MSMKEWFPHDYHATRDVKLMRLVRHGGAAYYGIYWHIVEMLHYNQGMTTDDLVDGLEVVLRVDSVAGRTALNLMINLDLFELCADGVVTCERIERNIEQRQALSQSRRNAASKRWDANAMQMQCKSNAITVQDSTIQDKTTDSSVHVSRRVAADQQRKDRPSSITEAGAYFTTLGMPESEAQRFVDYYTANGWKVGKNPMKDWKAAARNWKCNYKPQGATNGQVKRTVGDRAVEIDYPEYLANLYAMDLRGGPGGSVAQLGQGDGGAPELGAQSEHPTGQNEISVHGAATSGLSTGASGESADVDQVW